MPETNGILSLQQINKQAAKLAQKRNASAFIAYFQAYTNTYAPVEYLEKNLYGSFGTSSGGGSIHRHQAGLSGT